MPRSLLTALRALTASAAGLRRVCWQAGIHPMFNVEVNRLHAGSSVASATTRSKELVSAVRVCG
jgi:hypothetical protein